MPERAVRSLPHRSFPSWFVPTALVGLMLALQAGGEPVYQALRYDRARVLDGQAWRLLSAHAVHLGWAHCLMNAGGFALCAALGAGRRSAGEWVAAIAALALGVGALLVVASPETPDYAGLSGVLYGLFIWVLAPRAWRGDRWAWIGLAAVVARIGWQLIPGRASAHSAWMGGEVMVEAHLYGALCAMALCLGQETWPRWRRA